LRFTSSQSVPIIPLLYATQAKSKKVITVTAAQQKTTDFYAQAQVSGRRKQQEDAEIDFHSKEQRPHQFFGHDVSGSNESSGRREAASHGAPARLEKLLCAINLRQRIRSTGGSAF
jgi:hypothetical protein